MPTELVCAQPTKKYPSGRTGTRAGYGAHKRAQEPACEECLAVWRGEARKLYQPTGNPPGRPRVTEEHRRQVARNYATRWRAANPERARELARRGELKRDPERRREIASQTRQRRYRKLAELKNVPCSDCGVRYPPYVMHFDHRDPKEKLFNVSRAVGTRTWEVILSEVTKCDVVCANCHAERTWGPKAP